MTVHILFPNSYVITIPATQEQLGIPHVLLILIFLQFYLFKEREMNQLVFRKANTNLHNSCRTAVLQVIIVFNRTKSATSSKYRVKLLLKTLMTLF